MESNPEPREWEVDFLLPWKHKRKVLLLQGSSSILLVGEELLKKFNLFAIMISIAIKVFSITGFRIIENHLTQWHTVAISIRCSRHAGIEIHWYIRTGFIRQKFYRSTKTFFYRQTFRFSTAETFHKWKHSRQCKLCNSNKLRIWL